MIKQRTKEIFIEISYSLKKIGKLMTGQTRVELGFETLSN